MAKHDYEFENEIADEAAIDQAIRQMSIDELSHRNDAVSNLRRRVFQFEDHLNMYQQLERTRLMKMLSVSTTKSTDDLAELSLQELRAEAASIRGVQPKDSSSEAYPRGFQ